MQGTQHGNATTSVHRPAGYDLNSGPHIGLPPVREKGTVGCLSPGSYPALPDHGTASWLITEFYAIPQR